MMKLRVPNRTVRPNMVRKKTIGGWSCFKRSTARNTPPPWLGSGGFEKKSAGRFFEETGRFFNIILGGGNSNIFSFSPRKLGKWSNLSTIFHMGWNHQLGFSGDVFFHKRVEKGDFLAVTFVSQKVGGQQNTFDFGSLTVPSLTLT